MREVVVQLLRRFTPVTSTFVEILSGLDREKAQRWNEMEDLHRVLILAAPGAGKTFEARDRARKISERGKSAFFIRIEKIDQHFADSFEVGTAAEFERWLAASDDAWFFLDSVDEALLATPRALENAVRIFGARISRARERAHIFITSRADAWEALSDPQLIDTHLPFGDPDADRDSRDAQTMRLPDGAEHATALKIFRLAPLTSDEIKLFASYHGIADTTEFYTAIQRANLLSMAELPFDLRALVATWLEDKTFGSRVDVLRRLVASQLAPLERFDAPTKIDADKARTGVGALAAAATLTGRSVICLPDGAVSEDRLDPRAILSGWTHQEIDALLRHGIFDDVVYGAARFRHREIRELLMAEWASAVLSRPGGRLRVENLFFRNMYGEEVIVPRLRPVLPWLILLDDGIRDRALAIDPQVGIEGGDPSRLPLAVRQKMLADIVIQTAREAD